VPNGQSVAQVEKTEWVASVKSATTGRTYWAMDIAGDIADEGGSPRGGFFDGFVPG
jgi:hypothetical protein